MTLTQSPPLHTTQALARWVRAHRRGVVRSKRPTYAPVLESYV